MKSPIQAPYKFSKGQGVRDAHHKVHSGRRLGEVTFHDSELFVGVQEKYYQV